MKICFLGAGNIAQAIISGLLKAEVLPADIVCIERNSEKIVLLESQHISVQSLGSLADNMFDLIILAVKPKDAIAAAQDPNPDLIIRAMPNTAAAYNKGITALYANNKALHAFQHSIELFETVGHVMIMDREDDIHVFTSIVGSGQAFLFKILNTYLTKLKELSKGNDEQAIEMFKDFVGSLGDLFNQEGDFEMLINKIKSPGGTTQAGLESLEKNNIDLVIEEAFKAAEQRSIAINNES
jgi:pyrroline-5-carboxylate reductase